MIIDKIHLIRALWPATGIYITGEHNQGYHAVPYSVVPGLFACLSHNPAVLFLSATLTSQPCINTCCPSGKVITG